MTNDNILNEYEQFFTTYDIDLYKEKSYQILLKFITDEIQNKLFKIVDIDNIGVEYWETVSVKEWHPSISAHMLFAKSPYKDIIKDPLYK